MNKKVSLQLVSKRYAKALYNLSRDNNEIDIVAKDLFLIKSFLNDNAEISSIIANIYSPKKLQIQILNILLSLKLGASVTNFLNVIISNRRFYILLLAVEQYRLLLINHNNQIEAQITTSYKLSQSQLKEISDVLSSKYKKDIISTNKVDDKILGGMIIKMGSQMIDSSLANKLKLFASSSRESLLDLKV